MPCKVQPLLPSIGLELYQLGVQIWAKKKKKKIWLLIGQYWEKLGNFLFYHLVTLVATDRRMDGSREKEIATKKVFQKSISSYSSSSRIRRISNFKMLSFFRNPI